MSRSTARKFLALVVMAFPVGARAGVITLTDTEPILDFPDCDCGEKLPAVLPFALFDFSDQMPLATLDAIAITLTIEDGDTGPGELDEGNLSLALDTIDTGILFDGFAGGQESSLEFELSRGDPGWMSDAVVEDLILALQDGQVLAAIVDATPDDNAVNLYSVFDTTIRLTGEMLSIPADNPVPEPASLIVWGAAALAVLGWRRSRRRERMS